MAQLTSCSSISAAFSATIACNNIETSENIVHWGQNRQPGASLGVALAIQFKCICQAKLTGSIAGVTGTRTLRPDAASMTDTTLIPFEHATTLLRASEGVSLTVNLGSTLRLLAPHAKGWHFARWKLHQHGRGASLDMARVSSGSVRRYTRHSRQVRSRGRWQHHNPYKTTGHDRCHSTMRAQGISCLHFAAEEHAAAECHAG